MACGIVTSESPSCYMLATGPGISLQDEDQLSRREPALGPLLEAPCSPHHLTTTINTQTKPTLVVSYRTSHCHLYVHSLQVVG